MVPPRITCVFHSSPTIAGLINSPAGASLAGDLLIECAPSPALGFVLSLETPVNYPGIAGLLSGADLVSLAHAIDGVPAPIILAPGAGSTPGATRAALARLQRPDEHLLHFTLLVPLGHAPTLGAALAIASQFSIAWDVSEFPHEELVDFARWLGRERLVDRNSFRGVFAYASQPVDAAHTQRLTTLLAPLATAAHPAGVIALAS
jgi:hypothetical protein